MLRWVQGALLALAGAVLSPKFLSPEFRGPDALLSPQGWSVTFGIGAAVIAALAWWGAGRLAPRPEGAMANLLTGGSVAGTMLAGMMALGSPSQVGVIAALALGQLAAAMALVRDYAQVARDWRWRWGSLLLVSGSHLLALALLIQRTGMQRPVLTLFPALAMINLYLLERVGREPDYTAKAQRLTQHLLMGVVLLYVGAQTYY